MLNGSSLSSVPVCARPLRQYFATYDNTGSAPVMMQLLREGTSTYQYNHSLCHMSQRSDNESETMKSVVGSSLSCDI